MKYISINELIEEVKTKFKGTYPNGTILNWDILRFFKNFKTLFPELKVINQTDFNYSNCNSYDVILSKGQAGEKTILTIKISYIVDAFCMYVVSYSNKNNAKVIDEDSEDSKQYLAVIEKARQYMLMEGFREISSKEFEISIEEIDLELADIATLGKCLFDDH